MKKKLPVLLLAGVLGLGGLAGLASCSGGTPTESLTDTPTETPTEVPTVAPTEAPTEAPSGEKVAKRFEVTRLDHALLVGDSLDLSEKITVIYADDTKGHDIRIEEADGYTVEGSVVTFNRLGSYKIKVTAGSNNKPLRYEVTVQTLDRLEFNEFFKTIETNYTVSYIVPIQNEQGQTQLARAGFALHKDDEFFVRWFGEKLNTVQAKLKDGKYYEGQIVGEPTTPSDFDFKFNSGVIDWTQSFGSVSLQQFITPDSFESTLLTDEEGEYEQISASGQVAEKFVNATAAITYGGMATGIEFAGFINDEGQPKEALIAITLEVPTETGGVEEAVEFYSISNIGTTTAPKLEEYAKNGEIPAPIDTSIIDESFDSLSVAKNYTLDVDTVLLDSNGLPVTKEVGDAYPAKELIVADQTTVVTEESVSIKLGDEVLAGYLTDSGKLYKFGNQMDGETLKPFTSQVEGTLWGENSPAKSLLAPTVSASNLNYTKYVVEDGVHTFNSDAGVINYDAAGKVIANNAQFSHALWSNVVTLSPLFTGDESIADSFFNNPALVMKDDTKVTASILMSTSFAIDTVNNLIYVEYFLPLEVMGLATPDVQYALFTFNFSNIGTTVAPDLTAWTSTIVK